MIGKIIVCYTHCFFYSYNGWGHVGSLKHKYISLKMVKFENLYN